MWQLPTMQAQIHPHDMTGVLAAGTVTDEYPWYWQLLWRDAGLT